MSIGSRIKQRREELGFTQPQLAELVGVSKGTIGNYESNISSPNEAILFKLFSVLKCDANFLYQDNIDWQGFDTLSPSENLHITKYRTLDGYGRKAVDSVLDIEFERCESAKKKPTIVIRYSRLPASAGAGVFLDDENIELRSFPDTPEARQADIVIPVDGRSMEPMFYDGDLLLVKQQEEIEPGQIGIFIKDGKGYVKKLAEDRLISINPDYEDIYPGEDEEVICKGRVIGKV